MCVKTVMYGVCWVMPCAELLIHQVALLPYVASRELGDDKQY